MSVQNFPFKPKHINRNGLKYNYVDEGQGDPVVMVHGNPSWSFYYRNLIDALKGQYRCIAPDHIGCGLSDKPGDDQYTYTLKNRVDDLEALLDHLDVTKNVTLVVHDWGGMIGMAWATRHPERVKQIVVLNTSAFHLPDTKRFPLGLWICRNTWLGTVLVRGFNAFARGAAWVGCKRNPMPKELRDAYCAPYDSWDNRIATLRFVQDIPLRGEDPAYPIVTEVELKAKQFADRPMLICWGLLDFVFDKHFLKLWTDQFPQAEVHRFTDCGHYILEDAKDEVIGLVQRFLARSLPT
ncbi:MAG: alpha/beta fold hydrolase [Candidatus Hydrogenedentes bacterium]|nr:alpha/beta fold hydrolase [Candidatus Hydrogenedentota bacterium]